MDPTRKAPVGFAVTVTPLMPASRSGLCCQGLVPGLLLLLYPQPQIPKKPPPRLLFLAPVGPFVFGESGKTEIRIEQRAGVVVLGIWGFLLGVLDRRPTSRG